MRRGTNLDERNAYADPIACCSAPYPGFTARFRELAEDNILLNDIAEGIKEAVLVEDYPEAFKGPSILVLQRDRLGRPVHVVWGLEKGQTSPAVLVTAYRPHANRWSTDFLRRRR